MSTETEDNQAPQEGGEILCDSCGYYDYGDKFPVAGTEEYTNTLASFGTTPENVVAVTVGFVCPGCGNVSSFDMRPNDLSYLEH